MSKASNVASTATASSAQVDSRHSKLPVLAGAIVLGLSILFMAGFMGGPADAIHNAAHDARHAFAFPCH